MTPRASISYDGSVYIALSTAVKRAHGRLFPDEPERDPRTLRTIALALTALMPIHRKGSQVQLTELELTAERFTPAGMEELLVSERLFENALAAMQVESLDLARASLTLRQSPRYFNALR
jgi:hypothetical protein